jgi:starch synthase (maltosyl-transferring)
MRTLRFHHVDNSALLAYSKQDPETGDTVVTVVTLDPDSPQEGTVWLDLPSLGFDWGERLIAHDEVTGETWDWGQANYVRLEPWRAVAHIVGVQRRFSR